MDNKKIMINFESFKNQYEKRNDMIKTILDFLGKYNIEFVSIADDTNYWKDFTNFYFETIKNKNELEKIKNKEYNFLVYDELANKTLQLYNIDTLLNLGYIQCNDCGHWYGDDEISYYDEADAYICDGCIDEYDTCHNCGHIIFDTYNAQVDQHNNMICENCIENYFHCDDCGEFVHQDDINYCEQEDCYYCNDCIDNHNPDNFRDEYHSYKNELKFNKLEKEDIKKVLTYGFELETEKQDCDFEGFKILFNSKYKNNIINACERDGSLDEYKGCEFISNPFTEKYFYKNINHYLQFLEDLKNNGFISHNANCCGLHFHIRKLKR